MTAVPAPRTAPHAAPQSIPPWSPVTRPFPVEPTASGKPAGRLPPKATETALGPSIASEHVGAPPEQSPLHAIASPTARRVTPTPAPTDVVQPAPHSIPSGSTNTVPPGAAETASA